MDISKLFAAVKSGTISEAQFAAGMAEAQSGKVIAKITFGNDKTSGEEYETLRLSGGLFAVGRGAPSHSVKVWTNIVASISVLNEALKPATLAKLRSEARSRQSAA